MSSKTLNSQRRLICFFNCVAKVVDKIFSSCVSLSICYDFVCRKALVAPQKCFSMSESFVDVDEEVEPASDTQCNLPDVSEFPQTLVTEKIIFCVDILLLTRKSEESFIYTTFNLLSSYFNLKKKICVKPPEFECLLIVSNDKIIHSYINSLKDLKSTFLGIENFEYEEEEKPLAVDEVFKKIANIVELPDPYCHDKSIPPPWVYHIIWLFGQNLYIPTMENTNPFDFLMMSPYLALDILYIYDNSLVQNCCEQIFQALMDLNENGKGYFISANCNKKDKIFSSFAQLLGHPLIRSSQVKAKFNINELGPQEVTNQDNKDI